MITKLPGFQDVIHDSQRTFRSLLDSLAHPGRVYTLTANLTPPDHLGIAIAAACLTLFDLETWVWLQPSFNAEVGDWLQFHTGCHFTETPKQASFAVIRDAAQCPELRAFNPGTPEYPEHSTTLLVQIPSYRDGSPVQIEGPGIAETLTIAPSLPPHFWPQWSVNHRHYPLGIDAFLLHGSQVMGLPRSTAPKQS